MADYYARTRTNYFSVTDAEKLKTIMASCHASSDIIVFDEKQADGSIKYGFYCYGEIHGLPDKDEADDSNAQDDNDDCECSADLLYASLQEILPDGEAIIITEVGYEKISYLAGLCVVITNSGTTWINIHDRAIELAREMLNNADFTTKMDY